MKCNICKKESGKGTIYKGMGVCACCWVKGNGFDDAGNIVDSKGKIIIKHGEVGKSKLK